MFLPLIYPDYTMVRESLVKEPCVPSLHLSLLIFGFVLYLKLTTLAPVLIAQVTHLHYIMTRVRTRNTLRNQKMHVQSQIESTNR